MLTDEQVKDAEAAPACIDVYAEGYQLGRLHSMARIADVSIWLAQNTFSFGYRAGWRVQGRPV